MFIKILMRLFERIKEKYDKEYKHHVSNPNIFSRSLDILFIVLIRKNENWILNNI